MNAPTKAQAFAMLRARMVASITEDAQHMHSFTCPLCDYTLGPFVGSIRDVVVNHVEVHRDHLAEPPEWEADPGTLNYKPPTSLFWFWRRMSPATGWTPVSHHDRDLKLIYTAENLPDHLTEGRIAHWVMQRRALLKSFGVSVERRGRLDLIPLPIWTLLHTLATTSVTFEDDADAVFQSKPEAAANTPHREGALDHSA
jgi:hypothetical protein